MNDDEERQRPTPVRESMDAPREETPPPPPEPPAAHVQDDDGQEWVVRVEGRSETGGPGDAGAPLLYLTFARAEAPERRVREALRVGRSLAGLAEAELLAALPDARPYEGEWQGSDLFAGTRRKRGG